jgi:putative SOS response-associated peptidase YedK
MARRLWENWKDLTSGEWIRTFAIITTDANELVAEIHNRMPLILAPTDYIRWLSNEPGSAASVGVSAGPHHGSIEIGADSYQTPASVLIEAAV